MHKGLEGIGCGVYGVPLNTAHRTTAPPVQVMGLNGIRLCHFPSVGFGWLGLFRIIKYLFFRTNTQKPGNHPSGPMGVEFCSVKFRVFGKVVRDHPAPLSRLAHIKRGPPSRRTVHILKLGFLTTTIGQATFGAQAFASVLPSPFSVHAFVGLQESRQANSY